MGTTEAMFPDVQEPDTYQDGDGSYFYFLNERYVEACAAYEALKILLTESDNPEHAEFVETADFVLSSLGASGLHDYQIEGMRVGLRTLEEGELGRARWRCEEFGDQRACQRIRSIEQQISQTQRIIDEVLVKRELGQELWKEVAWDALFGLFEDWKAAYEAHGVRGLVNAVLADLTIAAVLFIFSFAATAGAQLATAGARAGGIWVTIRISPTVEQAMARVGRQAMEMRIRVTMDRLRPYIDRLHEIGDLDLNRYRTITPRQKRLREQLDVEKDVEGPPVKANDKPEPRKLKGVTEEEIALAGAAGQSPAQIDARKALAEAFLKETGAEGALNNIIGKDGGADLTKPFILREFAKGDSMAQWYRERGKPGNWFDPIGDQDPSALGLNSVGRQGGTFTAPGPGYALETTARKVDEFWSVKGMTRETDGGGKQWFIPDEYRPREGDMKGKGKNWREKDDNASWVEEEKAGRLFYKRHPDGYDMLIYDPNRVMPGGGDSK